MTALLKSVPTQQTKPVFVPPSLAEDWLARSRFNRDIRPRTVHSYARNMKCGAWGMSDSNICFDWDGYLLNGHHRLHAVIEAGIGVWFNVCWDMDPSSFRHMDRQLPRNITTLLKLDGHTHTHQLSAATSMFIRYHQGRKEMFTSQRRLISYEEIRTTAEANPDIFESVEYLHNQCNKLRTFSGSTSVMSLFHIMGTRVRGPEVTGRFFDGLNSGADLGVGSPIYALREKLHSLKTGNGKGHPQATIYGWYLPAWNAHVAGKRVVRLKHLDCLDPEIDITIR
jgi:hypothetical protein